MSAVLPLHPVVTGRDHEVRWVTPTSVLPFIGPVAVAPRQLAALLEDGTLEEVRAEPGAVVTLLAPGRAWTEEGPRVRRALLAALADPGGWRGAPGALSCSADDVLRAAAEEVLAGPVGVLVRSHGGELAVAAVQDGVVELSMRGACHGCPAAGTTLHARFERELRRRCPDLVGEVREAAGRPSREPKVSS